MLDLTENKKITLSANGCSVEITPEGACVDGILSSGREVVDGLAKVFGEPSKVFLSTGESSLEITPDGTVLINGVVVAADHMILARATTFFLSLAINQVKTLGRAIELAQKDLNAR